MRKNLYEERGAYPAQEDPHRGQALHLPPARVREALWKEGSPQEAHEDPREVPRASVSSWSHATITGNVPSATDSSTLTPVTITLVVIKTIHKTKFKHCDFDSYYI